MTINFDEQFFPVLGWEWRLTKTRKLPTKSDLAIVVRTDIKDAHELYQTARPWHRRIYDCVHPFLAPAFRLHTGWHR